MARINHDDTIAAIATPIGEGAIAVIRISGADALHAADRVFVGKSKLTDAPSHTVLYGRIFDRENSEVDEVLAAVFRNPNSYTGEDSVEVSCHGGMFVTQRILETILSTGIRQADAGEFTMRSFLNGKMDLSQAEAVADIISARSEASHKASVLQLEGRFSEEIRRLKSDMLNVCSLLELELDFSEDGIDLISKSDVLRRIDSLKRQMQSMVDSYRFGKVHRDGVSVAIVGKPNAGKSSLFNALLRENRAIVTEFPGTTRDTLEEAITIGGILFRFTDTAGIRPTTDLVEKEGVARAHGIVSQSDVLVIVDDASNGLNREGALSFLSDMDPPEQIVIAYNKIDLWEESGFRLSRCTNGKPQFEEVLVSARTGAGIDELKKTLGDIIADFKIEGTAIQVTNARHVNQLRKSIELLGMSELAVESGSSGEFIALDIRAAADCLGEIVGEITTEDVLSNIFSHFCIGK